MKLHPIQRRWYAEDLVRLRRSDEQRRYAAPQRSGRIDANPHQIEAVIFALSRIGDGGCILADEVGLGKTIEAGLVIAQLRAEGAKRILLITPKPLLGQWKQELAQLFGIDAAGDARSLEGEGVFLVGREAAGGEKGHAALLAAPGFDLVVIDEAHEVFGGLYKRFDAEGALRDDAPVARTAGRVFDLVRASQAPVLLLTATPIQNSLTELWALVRYVDPAGTLLGDLRTFRQTFCDRDDRMLVEGQADELRRRIAVVLSRTLRRQAQEFLSKPFVARQSRLFTYHMAEEERALYDDVTRWLLTPTLFAFRGKQRRLLLIAFHRRMASSTAALAASLEKVAERLEKMKARGVSMAPDDGLVEELVGDLEDEDLYDLAAPAEEAPADAPLDPKGIDGELARVRSFIARARKLGLDGKSKALLQATNLVFERKRLGQGSGKIVIFTESVVTQDYLHDLLIEKGMVAPEEITLFRGDNETPRAKLALERWLVEKPGERPPRDVAIRLALVHEFRERSRILISTEAGAKGLNLQFCETVINYDLPWNPQRIEQRIGRCHRYGQTRDVTVINFLAADNETEQLTFEILARKLELFGTVLDASDAVLHRSSDRSTDDRASVLGADLENSLNRIWQRARTLEDVQAELRELRDRVDEARKRFEEEQDRTRGLIESYFDEEVRRVFTKRKKELPAVLAALDADLERVARAHLEAIGVPYTVAGGLLEAPPDPRLPEELRQRGVRVAIGAAEDLESLNLLHPLIVAAVREARAGAGDDRPVAIKLPKDAHPELLDRRGGAGRLVGVLVRYQGLERVDRLMLIAMFEGDDEPLDERVARTLLDLPMRDLDQPVSPKVDGEAIDDAIEEIMFDERKALSAAETPKLEKSLEQLERYVEDRLRVLARQKREAEKRLDDARARRDAAISVEARESAEGVVVRTGEELEHLDAEIDRLGKRDDETYRRCKDRLHQRRYAPAATHRLFDVGMVLE